MTAMPQMVALFNGVGGGAVVPDRLGRSSASPTASRARPTYVAIFSLFAAIVGSISFWGSNIAFGKLQEILPGRPIKLGSAQQIVNLAAAGARGRRRRRDRRGRRTREALFIGMLVCRGAARQHGRAADRRRRHAGRDLAAERVHRPVGGGDRHRAGQHRADRRRHDRRRLGHDPHEPDGRVAMNRSVPAIVAGGFGGGGAVEGADGAGDARAARCARRARPTPRSSSPTPAGS